MEEKQERLFSYLYFVPKEQNGKAVPGKFEPLKVRFLYTSMDQIPAGRVHLHKYAPKKVTRVLCLRNGKKKSELESVDCPLCAKEAYGTPSNKYYAFVVDENDEGKLKLLEFNWSLGKLIDEIAEIKGKPLHDMVFTLSKKGQGKDTTYTPIFEEYSKFNVKDYFATLGISDYPKLVGNVDDKAPILMLTHKEITDFIAGQFPWSKGDGESYTPRKYTMLGSTVTVRDEQANTPIAENGTAVEDIEEDDVEIVDDTPKSESFF